jgi:hypothetical protein
MCDHKTLTKEGRFWVCDNLYCYLTDEEKDLELRK